MRRALDAVYVGAGVLAAVFLVLIGLFVLAQIGGRLIGRAVPSADEFAGYCLSASSFLALAYTLRHNGHIRVSLVIERLGGGMRRGVEVWCLAVATALIGYFAFYTVSMVWDSYMFQDRTMGLVPIMLWVPQTGMAIGVSLLALAFAEELVRVLRGRPASYELVPDPLGDASGESVPGGTGHLGR